MIGAGHDERSTGDGVLATIELAGRQPPGQRHRHGDAAEQHEQRMRQPGAHRSAAPRPSKVAFKEGENRADPGVVRVLELRHMIRARKDDELT